MELFPPTPRSRGRPIDQKPASEAIPEGELSAQVLPAVRGNALAHDDLVDKEVGEEVVAEPWWRARQRDPALNNVRAHVNARWPQTTL